MFSYIESDNSINEVILSGGDPLMLPLEELKNILARLDDIDHVKTIRIHSRLPIVMPESVNPQSFETKKSVVLVVHCNHPNEIDDKVKARLKELREMGVIIFNQSVLLKNINDNIDALVDLSEKLFEVGVIPYYLHILDRVKGTAHFYVNIDTARKIYFEMQERLPGYLVPKLVVETEKGKEYV